ALSVVADGSNGTRDVRAVEILRGRFKGLIGAVEKIPAVYVIDKTIAVVIDTVPGKLSRVHPGVGGKVFVLKLDSRVQDYRNYIIAAGRDIPRASGVDVGAIKPGAAKRAARR